MSVIEFSPEQMAAALQQERTVFDPKALAYSIAREHGIDFETIMGPRRMAHVMAARRALYQALRARGWSYPAIGDFVGGRDHTTVMAGCRK